MNLDDVRQEWIQLRPLYEAFAVEVQRQVRAEALRRGVFCSVDHRAKEVASLLKKCLKKGYTLQQIGDKAGVRAVVPYKGLIPRMDPLIMETFDVRERDDKSEGLDPDRMRYLGIHYQLKLRPETLSSDQREFVGIECELQLHTRAQNLWSDTTHDLSYKGPRELDKDAQRALNRLIAVSEIYDNELETARKTILSMTGYEEARILDHLERNYYQLSAMQFDRELSLLVISDLKGVIEPKDVEAYGSALDDFVREHRSRIEEIYAIYSEDPRAHPLMTQPESILIFRELDVDRFRLASNWRLPIDTLETMANAWGTSVEIDS